MMNDKEQSQKPEQIKSKHSRSQNKPIAAGTRKTIQERFQRLLTWGLGRLSTSRSSQCRENRLVGFNVGFGSHHYAPGGCPAGPGINASGLRLRSAFCPPGSGKPGSQTQVPNVYASDGCTCNPVASSGGGWFAFLDSVWQNRNQQPSP